MFSQHFKRLSVFSSLALIREPTTTETMTCMSVLMRYSFIDLQHTLRILNYFSCIWLYLMRFNRGEVLKDEIFNMSLVQRHLIR